MQGNSSSRNSRNQRGLIVAERDYVRGACNFRGKFTVTRKEEKKVEVRYQNE